MNTIKNKQQFDHENYWSVSDFDKTLFLIDTSFTILIHCQRFPNMLTMNCSGCYGLQPDVIEWFILAGKLHVLLEQLLNITPGYWTRQHTVFWTLASGHISPTDEYYWEYGMKLYDFCHRVKHIIWSMSSSQRVLAGALYKPDLYIINLLAMIHSQHQGLTVGVYGAVSYQKCPVLVHQV